MPLTIEECRALGDPQKSYKWEVKMPPIGEKSPSLLDSGKSLLNRQAPSGLDAQAVLRAGSSILNGNLPLNRAALRTFDPSLYVEEVQGMPFPNVDREDFYEGGRKTYFASIEEVGTVTLVLYQDESGRIPKYMMDWKHLIRNQDGTLNYPTNYKKPIVVHLLNGLNVKVGSWRLVGCFPTNTMPYTLNNASDRVTWVQEFSVDRVEKLDISAESIISETLSNRIKKILPRQLNDLDNLVSGSEVKDGITTIKGKLSS